MIVLETRGLVYQVSECKPDGVLRVDGHKTQMVSATLHYANWGRYWGWIVFCPLGSHEGRSVNCLGHGASCRRPDESERRSGLQPQIGR